jgi:hypothetical protein
VITDRARSRALSRLRAVTGATLGPRSQGEIVEGSVGLVMLTHQGFERDGDRVVGEGRGGYDRSVRGVSGRNMPSWCARGDRGLCGIDKPLLVMKRLYPLGALQRIRQADSDSSAQGQPALDVTLVTSASECYLFAATSRPWGRIAWAVCAICKHVLLVRRPTSSAGDCGSDPSGRLSGRGSQP